MTRAGETVADRQSRYLIAMRETITESAAASAAGVTRGTAYQWRRGNVEGFAARYDEAIRDRANNLETLMFDVLQWANSDERYEKLLRHPNLLMFALKGAWPERYGERNIVGADDAKRLMDEVQKLKDNPPVSESSEVETIDEQINRLLGT